MRSVAYCLGLFLSLSLLVACSDDSNPPAADKPVAAQDTGSADVYPDLGTLPDIGTKAPCESEWIDAVGAVAKVSTGSVQSTDKGSGVTETTIDATAGGINAAKSNPYVYVSLKDGSRVDVSDVDAKKSSAWDIAIRRSVIRINGGDSGAGQGGVAILAGKTLDQVTAVPPSVDFHADEFIDDSCQVSYDPINNILTAFGGQTGLWYDYEVGSGKLTPLAQAYVIRLADGQTHVKLVIDSYYSPGNTSAFYTVRWSKL
ncbi:MAG: HmuY family protein [Myxococcales bacterium]|nr:HmuY family protein [Myxococcales bacterium]